MARGEPASRLTMVGLISNAGAGVRAAWQSLPRPERLRISGWAAWIAAATLAFVQPLSQLVALAGDNELHSHIPLVPVVTAYLLWIQRGTLPAAGRTAPTGALALGSVSVAALAWGLTSSDLSATDRLAVMTLAYVAAIAAGGFLFLGARWMAAAAFPIAFLLFLVPLPDAAVDWLERASVQASADVAEWMFRVTGTPLLREGTIFALPTIVVEVARECSGIRSSWVLFITSLVASHMFLKSPWRQIVLVAFVIPLGIVRNGFRILVIGLLCVHVGPHMIDSVIHHRGGPIFFVLSLVPLFLLLTWLRRRDRVA
jgi:exosortase C (VPDSG-CTERM-specific)